jgi:hypothetical protein
MLLSVAAAAVLVELRRALTATITADFGKQVTALYIICSCGVLFCSCPAYNTS